MTKKLLNSIEAYEAPALYVVDAQVEAGFGESLGSYEEEEF
jgi:hypothetical protein